MARGLRKGDGGAHLMTFHPTGGSGSSESFHDEDWLDFNMRQNGHVAEFTGRYDQTRADYDRTPVKPVLDGEPIYEDHPVSFKAAKLGHSIAADVRRPLYWDLFAGACGHTYGHHSVWQMWAPGRKPINNPLMPWSEAIDQPGAGQMQHGRRLLESRPFLTRVPDDTVIVDRPRAHVGAGRRPLPFRGHARRRGALRHGLRAGRPAVQGADAAIRARGSRPGGSTPATARRRRSATSRTRASVEFAPPDPGELLDWVLVLDDAAQGFPPPGTTR